MLGLLENLKKESIPIIQILEKDILCLLLLLPDDKGGKSLFEMAPEDLTIAHWNTDDYYIYIFFSRN